MNLACIQLKDILNKWLISTYKKCDSSKIGFSIYAVELVQFWYVRVTVDRGMYLVYSEAPLWPSFPSHQSDAKNYEKKSHL
jgi:hypothetical protein